MPSHGAKDSAASWRRRRSCVGCSGSRHVGGGSTKVADDAPDVRAAIPGVHFEVKRVEALRLYPALEQAAADAGENVPVVLHRANQQPWVAIVRLDDLPKLAVQLYLTLAENA